MANHLLLVVAFSLAIAVCLMEAKKPDKSHKIPAKWRRGKKGKADEGMASFKNDIDELRAELDDMKQQCGASNVHFFFHGEGHDAGHQDHEGHGEDDVHVHVDLHLDGSHGDGDNHDHVHVAQCQMKDGFVKIVQQVPQEKYAKFMFSFDSLNDGVIDVHVHQNGDMSTGCSGLGPHYDPIDPERDVGDLGIINPDSDDIKAVWFNNTKLSLIGPHSIIGRSIMGHAKDGALMCCVIGVGKDDHDHDHEGHGHEGHDHEGHGHEGHDHEGHGHEGHGHEGHSHAHEGHDHAH